MTATAVTDAAPGAADTLPAEVDIAIVGAGFSGLGTAIRLTQEGYHDFIVLERGDDVGGTWHFNTYPNCGCDVPSHLYSFSFAPNPDWTRTYSRQPEIRDYLRRVTDEYGIRDRIRTATTVTAAEWDETDGRWTVQTDAGTLRARVVIAGLGPLTEPNVPDLPGLDSFEGKVMHSARWDHDYDLDGKRVASVGTGASAIQYVPAIQPKVEHLTVFQRTAPWVLPHTDRPIKPYERRLYNRFPALQKLVRGFIYGAREANIVPLVKNPRLMRVVQRVAERHIRHQVTDPEMRRRLTPDYTIGCKRMLPSNKWYPAITKPNVDVVSSPVAEVRPHGVVDADGNEHEADTIIFGTGFNVTDIPIGQAITGRDGRTLADVWQGSPQAYLGTAIPGFPNLFMLLGPNTGLGHSSMIYMIESQIAHVLAALDAMRRAAADRVEVRADVAAAFNREVDSRAAGTVWNTGCASWYVDRNGRNSTLWPDWTWMFRRRSNEFDEQAYTLKAGAPVAAPTA